LKLPSCSAFFGAVNIPKGYWQAKKCRVGPKDAAKLYEIHTKLRLIGHFYFVLTQSKIFISKKILKA
jgi:hypothetical protein